MAKHYSGIMSAMSGEKLAPPGVQQACFMCQIDKALRQHDPESMPPPISTLEQAESSMTTLLCCGASTYLMCHYRRTRVVRKFIAWMLGAYLLLLLAFIFFVGTVYLL